MTKCKSWSFVEHGEQPGAHAVDVQFLGFNAAVLRVRYLVNRHRGQLRNGRSDGLEIHPVPVLVGQNLDRPPFGTALARYGLRLRAESRC